MDVRQNIDLIIPLQFSKITHIQLRHDFTPLSLRRQQENWCLIDGKGGSHIFPLSIRENPQFTVKISSGYRKDLGFGFLRIKRCYAGFLEQPFVVRVKQES